MDFAHRAVCLPSPLEGEGSGVWGNRLPAAVSSHAAMHPLPSRERGRRPRSGLSCGGVAGELRERRSVKRAFLADAAGYKFVAAEP